MDTEQYVKWFRSTSPYINSNRGKTFVLAMHGDLLDHANFATLVEDIILLHSLGVKLVLCLGVKPQLEKRLQEAGIHTEIINGIRITSNECMPIALETNGVLRSIVEAALSRGPSQNQRLRIITGNFVTAKPIGIIDGKDYLHTGEVRKVDTAGIRQQLDLNNLTLLTALANSPSGEAFNVCAQEVACKVAIALQADKLIVFSKDEGLLDNHGHLIQELNLRQANSLLGDSAHEDRWSNLRCAITACDAGVTRTQIVSYSNPNSLLTELFSRDGSGTLVSRHLFEDVRNATVDDISAIVDLIAPLEDNGTLMRRSREKLEEEIGYFSVIERDTSVIACAALYPFADDKAAELACVVTHPEYRGAERGNKLLRELVRKAQVLGITRLFVLTTKTAHWFLEQGFIECSKDLLPMEKQALYNMQRNSKVLQLDLTSN